MSGYVYHMDEGVLTVPEGFVDATMHNFEWIGPEGRRALMVQRQLPGPDESFEALVARITKPYAKIFADYAEEPADDVDVGMPAVSKRFRWRHESGVLYHHQVFVDVGRVVLAITASGKASVSDEVDAILQQAISGLRLRERD